MDNWYDYQNNNIGDFIKAYRESLQAQRDSSIKQLNQTRKNYFGSIMGGANRRGMMYSNFPQRDKIIYDTNTYNPSLVKIQTSYQTGLDTLRNNAVSLWNKIKSYNEATSDLNSYGATTGGSTTTGGTAGTAASGTTGQTKTEEEKKKKNKDDYKESTSTGASGKGYSGGGGGGGSGSGW